MAAERTRSSSGAAVEGTPYCFADLAETTVAASLPPSTSASVTGATSPISLNRGSMPRLKSWERRNRGDMVLRPSRSASQALSPSRMLALAQTVPREEGDDLVQRVGCDVDAIVSRAE